MAYLPFFNSEWIISKLIIWSCVYFYQVWYVIRTAVEVTVPLAFRTDPDEGKLGVLL